MSVQVNSVRLITKAQAQEHIQDALDIVAELEVDDELRELAFVQACAMLSQRAAVQEMGAPMHLDLGKLRQGPPQ